MSHKVVIQIVDPSGAPINGASVAFQGQPPHQAWDLGGVTAHDPHPVRPDMQEGIWRFDTVDDGVTPARVSAAAPGLLSWSEILPVPATGDWIYRRTLDRASAPHLEVRGNDFVDASGQPVTYSACDMFQAFRFFLDGRTQELEALAKESLSFGFQWWRVLMMGSKAQNTLFDLNPNEPNFYPSVTPFAQWCNDHGIGLLAEVYADNQDVQAPVPGHWQMMADRLRGSTTILSGGNEWQKNGFDPQALTDPGMIWSRGSGTADAVTPQDGATVASFHQRTDYPATVQDATASVIYMEEHGYTVVMCDEPTRFDENSNKSGQPDSVRFAWELARVYGTFWDLACFHNYCGQRCQLLTPNLRQVAAAWQRGLKAA